MSCFTVRFADVTNGKDGIYIKDLVKSDKPGKGASAAVATSDKLYVWNGGSYDLYFLHTSGEWRKDGETSETQAKITFATAFFYKKGSLTKGNATFSGEVANDTSISIPVNNNSMSFLTFPWPVERTLEEIVAGIDKQGKGASDLVATSDKIYKWNGGSYDIYYHHTNGSWCPAGSTTPITAGSVVFGPNEGFFLKKGSLTKGNIVFTRPF